MISRQKPDAALLGTLFSAQGQRISLHDLAQASGIPSVELETRLAPYREAGYPVLSYPQGGIGLLDPPDIWCAEEILGRCPVPDTAAGLVWDPLLLTETASTNDVVREQARKGARAGFLVAASRQTRGRGRLGRIWESPPNQGLYVSILLRPDWPCVEAGKLTILSSVAAVDAVEAIAGFRPQIKWPNDLVAHGKKLAGILIETEPNGSRLAFAVVGLGINVSQQTGDFPPELRSLATSLRLATGHSFRRADVLVATLHALQKRLDRPFAEAREAWAASSLTLGQRVVLTTSRGRRHGQALGLDESGALLLRTDTGEVEAVTSGDMEGQPAS